MSIARDTETLAEEIHDDYRERQQMLAHLQTDNEQRVSQLKRQSEERAARLRASLRNFADSLIEDAGRDRKHRLEDMRARRKEAQERRNAVEDMLAEIHRTLLQEAETGSAERQREMSERVELVEEMLEDYRRNFAEVGETACSGRMEELEQRRELVMEMLQTFRQDMDQAASAWKRLATRVRNGAGRCGDREPSAPQVAAELPAHHRHQAPPAKARPRTSTGRSAAAKAGARGKKSPAARTRRSS